MSPQSTILFDPNLDERALDKETDKVNQQLAGVGEDIPVNFDEEMPDMDGLSPAGAGGGGGGIGAGTAAGAGGLASKIPKPMAGVAAASVLPVGIAGAVGAGMLSAMHSASARLQTSTSLLHQAWTNVWRPLGDKLDQFFIRDLALDLVEDTQDLGQAIRDMDIAGAIRSIGDILFEGASADWLAAIVPGGLSIQIYNWFRDQILGIDWGQLWTDVTTRVQQEFNRVWPPNITGVNLGQWVTGVNLGNWIQIPGWLSSGQPGGGQPRGPGSRSQPTEPLPSSVQRQLDRPTDLISLQSGGRVTRSGAAQVHRGELVADPDRLVNELASAVSSATGGGARRGMDTSGLRREVEGLRRDVKQLASALDVTVEIGNETVARAAARGQQDGISDSNPRVN